MIHSISIEKLMVFGNPIRVPSACVEIDSIEYEKDISARKLTKLKRINGKLTVNGEKADEPEEAFHELKFTAKVWQSKAARDAREHYVLLSNKEGNTDITVDLTEVPDLETYFERIDKQMSEEDKLELLTEQYIQKYLVAELS